MKRLSWLIVLTLALMACTAPFTSLPPTATPPPRTFDGTLAYHWVEQQCALGPRLINSEANIKAGDQIIAELKAQGWEVEEQKSAYENVPFRNILAVRRGEGPAILIGAHYDSRKAADREDFYQPVPGANDGASGVGILLELARALDTPLHNTVYLAFFDAEDNGNLDGWPFSVGAEHLAATWNDNPNHLPLAAVVVVDMTGDADQQLYYEVNSNQELSAKIWAVAAGLNYGDRFIPEQRHTIIDDHLPFIQRGIKAVDIIDFDYPYWHTTQDTPDKVSAASLESVGRTLETWLESNTAP